MTFVEATKMANSTQLPKGRIQEMGKSTDRRSPSGLHVSTNAGSILNQTSMSHPGASAASRSRQQYSRRTFFMPEE